VGGAQPLAERDAAPAGGVVDHVAADEVVAAPAVVHGLILVALASHGHFATRSGAVVEDEVDVAR
jgi:hypothetical protein